MKMRETERNIRRYRKQLIHTKEKVITSIMLFVMSAVMLTTASLAWLVLSVSPEVSNIQTTIAGNGNLEIALAHSEEDGTLAIPSTSQVGDGMLSLVEKNKTWGNLVNLGTDAYGLHKIVLRPAALYSSNLLEAPLVAVAYGQDGRVTYLDNSGLKYSNYDATANNNSGAFVIENTVNYGVRAVSSVKSETFDNGISEKVSIIRNGSLKTIQNDYLSLIDENIETVADIMEFYMSEKVLDKVHNYYQDLDKIIPLMKEFQSLLESSLNVYAQIANHQTGNRYADGNALLNDSIIQSFLNDSTVNATVEEQFETQYNASVMNGLNDILEDYKQLGKYIIQLENVKTLESSSEGDKNVGWSQISESVNYLVNIGECEIYPNGFDGQMYLVKNIGSKAALSLMGGKDMKGLVTKGAIKRFEQVIGAKIDVQDLTLSVSIASLDADISTSAKAPYTINIALANLLTYLNNGAPVLETAADIYGMVIDFWLRTNAKDSYITLEGEPVTEERVLTALVEGKNYDCYVDANKKVFYFVPMSGEGYTGTRDLSGQISDDERNYLLTSGTFWNKTTGQELVFDATDSDDNGYSDAYASFVNETIIDWARETVVIGYDGENRVWEETPNLFQGGTSATQGKGSCYIFYPSSVVEQEQMLKLLSGLSVVFIDSEGNMLTSAKLNTKSAYEDSGKVTVPLELVDTSPTIDISGEETKVISKISQNEELFISAIVYLDGELVTNDLVDASTGVVGYLNLQFGSTAELNPVEDKKLQEQVIYVTGGLGNNNADKVSLSYEKDQLKTKVNINIIGTTSENVSIKFTRKINANQGVIMDEIPLTKVDGVWTNEVTFTNPGTYVLRSVWIDGVEYEFSDKKELTVDIEGLSIDNVWLSTNTNNIYYMSDSNKYVVNVYTTVKANAGIKVNTVQGLFRDSSGGYITVNMTNDETGTWGSAVAFTKSGTYTLDTILINGDAYEIPKENQKVITLNLGITAEITLGLKSAIYEGTPSESIKVQGLIKDSSGKIMNDLTNVFLTYSVKGSDINPAWAELKWNSSTNKYEGNIKFGSPGIYEFQSLGINRTVVNINPDQDIDGITFTNTIDRAKADSFAFIPMDPPTYTGNVTDAYQFAPNDDGIFSINIDNSISATVAAEVVYVNQDGKEEEPVLIYNDANNTNNVTKKTTGSTTTWNFKLPSHGTTSQNGTWRLKEVRMIGVFVDNHMYMFNNNETWTTEDADYYAIDLSKKDIEVYIVNDIRISVQNTDSVAFEKDVFTTSLSGDYYRENQLTISDYFGKSLNTNKVDIDLNLTKMMYEHNPSSVSWWIDPTTSIDTNIQNPTSSFKKKVDSENTYVSNSKMVFYYGGGYSPKLELRVVAKSTLEGSSSYDYVIRGVSNVAKANGTTADMIVVNNFVSNETILWEQPDAQWNSVYPNESSTIYYGVRSYKISGGNWSPWHTYGLTNTGTIHNVISSDKKNIDVYMRILDGTTEWSSGHVKEVTYGRLTNYYYDYVNIVPSTATVSISNLGDKYSEATITFNDSNDNNIVFSFNSNSTISTSAVSIGTGMSAGEVQGYNITPVARGSNAEYIVTTYNGKPFKFKLVKELTINANNSTGW